MCIRDRFQTANTLVEQMTGWRLSTGGDTRGQYIPNKHRIERNLWRDLGSILPQADSTDDNITPGVVRWLTLIKERNLLEEGLVQLCAVGFKYGPMEAKIDAMAVDTLLIHNDIFTELGSRWMPLINNLLGLTDECVRKLAVLASDLAKAAGDIDSLHYRAGEGRAKICRAEAYYRMDEPFRRWLAGIHPLKTDMGEAEQEWIRVLKHILFQLGAEMGHQYGEKAIVGRWVDVYKRQSFTWPTARPISTNSTVKSGRCLKKQRAAGESGMRGRGQEMIPSSSTNGSPAAKKGSWPTL